MPREEMRSRPAESAPGRPPTFEDVLWRVGQSEERISEFEQRLSGQPSPDDLATVRREVHELRALVGELPVGDKPGTGLAGQLAKLAKTIGEAPNLAEDKPGSGMTKQLSELIAKDRNPRIATYITAVFTGLVLVAQGVQLLKTLGILK